MNSLPAATAAYTPLESFLLFNYLKSQGADHSAFRKISTLLQENPNIKSDPKFDSGRLSADALNNFYLRLLFEETRSELERQNGAQDDLSNGDGPASSKKRKAASPSLPTVKEASQNVHLIPQLISKLYTRFRSIQVREIRDQERRYDELQREVKDIEQGQWNDRIQREIQKGQWDAVLGQAGLVNGQSNGSQTPEEPAASSAGRALSISTQGTLVGQAPDITIKSASQSQPLSATQSEHGSAGLSPSSRTSDRKSPVPKTNAMPPPSITQRLAPQLSPSPPVHSPQNRGPSGQSPWQGGSPQPHGPQQQSSQSVGPSGTPHVPFPKGATGYGSPSTGPQMQPYPQPPSANVTPRPPHQQPGYRPSRVGGIELPPFQLNSTPARPSNLQPPPPLGFSSVPPPGQNAQPFIRQADGRMVPLPPHSLLDGIMRGLSRNWKQAYGQKTRWKKSANAKAAEVSAPERESLSPPPPSTSASRSTRRKTRGTPLVEQEPDVRRSTIRSRKVRGGSVASSAVPSSMRSRTRSQSVTSHMSVDNESVAGRKVKHEPGTPMDDEVSATIEASPSGALQRGRRALAQQSTQMSRKRRRSVHDTSEPSEFSQEPLPQPAAPQTHVLVSKNFARTCNPILNDILSHKHASLFSSAVKERDAPGYSDLILRPQDFKSIKTAMSVGSRTVAAALADALPSGDSPAPGGASGPVLLPVSADLVPPKAIVNSTQLEKEIMRVFANAAMYNIGDDPVVQDAREMFESVQKSVSDWRSIEKSSEPGNVPVIQRQATREVEDSDVDELAGDGGSVAAGKRRKLV